MIIINNIKITINKTTEKRINGKPISEDIYFYECWAEILQLYGTELYQAINIKLENTVVFKVRYCRKLDELLNKEDYKIKYRGKQYKLYYADFSKEPKKYVLLKCNQVI